MRLVTTRFAVNASMVLGAILIGAASLSAMAAEESNSTQTSSAQTSLNQTGKSIQVITSYQNDVSLPLYYLPPWQGVAGEGREGPENPQIPNDHVDEPDPVIQGSFGATSQSNVPGMPAPIQNFDGIPFPGVGCNCAPPDTDGEVGATQYVQMVNNGFQIFDKATGASLAGPTAISALWAGFGGVCQNTGNGDPIVLYDQLANRWIISQFAGSTGAGVPVTDECIAVSTTSDATGTYNRYGYHLGSNFFDYPHLGMWPDGYYMAMNIFNTAGTARLGPQAFVFDRSAMLAGTTATIITPGITGGASEPYFLPADLDGANPPPAGAPAPFVEWPSGGAYKFFRYHVDFATPANSSFTQVTPSPVAAGFTQLCSGTRACVPQLGGTGSNAIDGIGDRLMFRLAYRNFDDHESLVGNFTVSASSVAAIRWFEMRNATSGTPTIFQQSTYQPDTDWRWLGSIAMDFVGNIAVGYNASSATINPQLRYAGRLFNDPVNTLAQGEAHLFDGTGSQTGTGNRWGDYSDLTVDPVDDCTFWYTSEYYATTGTFNWRTRIGSFKFPNCSLTPGFTLAATPANVSACAGTPATVTINVGSTSSFNSPVTLSSTGYPATLPIFTPNPVPSLPGTSSMQIDTAAAPAVYPIQVNGTASMATNQSTSFNLIVFNAPPGAPVQTAPINAATNQAVRPVFTWTGSNTETYTIDVATDAGFSNIVYTNTVTGTTVTPNVDLQSNTQFHWRVTATNACDMVPVASVFTFTTLPLPGDCSTGTSATNVYSYGFESGANGWTLGSGSTGNTWALSAAQPHSGTQSFFAADPAAVSDQRLVSPPIVLPSGQLPLTLQFWHRRFMEISGTTQCWDGGILEVSTNGGSTFTQIPSASLLTDPYLGTIRNTTSNPLADLPAWCSTAVVPYLNSIVDISAYQGQTAQFRFRLGSDTSIAREGWYIDDVKVQSCAPPVDEIFTDGFNPGP
ncbi:MAG: hypothetical protein ABI451_04915 [Dokdonella sp.]